MRSARARPVAERSLFGASSSCDGVYDSAKSSRQPYRPIWHPIGLHQVLARVSPSGSERKTPLWLRPRSQDDMAPIAFGVRLVLLGGLLAALLAPLRLDAQARIEVGENIRVSGSHPEEPHYEYLASAHPSDPNKLLACSNTVGTRSPMEERVSRVYASHDGGKSWKATLDVPFSGDPVCEFGTGDTAYFLVIPLTLRGLMLFRSEDGGLTWDEGRQVGIPAFIDRPYLTTDRSGGELHGRVYINGLMRTPMIEGEGGISEVLMHSEDGGRTFSAPILQSGPDSLITGPNGNAVVLPNGSVAVTFGLYQMDWHVSDPDPPGPDAKLLVLTSSDGGRTFNQSVVVSDWYLPMEGWTIAIPTLAVDTSGGPFHGRLYVAWLDGHRKQPSIRVAYSDDLGKSWSRPRIVTEKLAPSDPAGPNAYHMPKIAVNRDGVVGVAWYDRRGREDLGWTLRFSASLDGGDVYTPDVQVSSATNRFDREEEWPLAVGDGAPQDGTIALNVQLNAFFYFNSGHTSGLIADASGVFHPVWGDNRTGLSQLWTAPVRVQGKAMRHGDVALESYVDITPSVRIDLSNPKYDRATDVVTVQAVLHNAGSETIEGPVKLRIITLDSKIGEVSIRGSENGAATRGAVIDVSRSIPEGGLAPKSRSAPTQLSFQLTDTNPILRETIYDAGGIVTLTTKVLAGSRNSRH